MAFVVESWQYNSSTTLKSLSGDRRTDGQSDTRQVAGAIRSLSVWLSRRRSITEVFDGRSHRRRRRQ